VSVFMSLLKKIYDLFFTLIGLAFVGFIVWAVITSGNDNAAEVGTVPEPEFSQPAQVLPQTGAGSKSFNNAVAPLEIKTSRNGGYHYFVKIVDAYTDRELGRFFIRSGETLDIEVPLGSYEIRYASGKTWYGVEYLFGPDTTYSKADSVFHFTYNGYQYSGYTVELIMQQHGNLSTSRLNASQW